MRIAFFDPASGASGDMLLAALVDAGASLDTIRQQLDSLALQGYSITATPGQRGAVNGTQIWVTVDENQPRRDWREIRRLIETSGLDSISRDRSLAVFTLLAETEATVHGQPVDEVQFHEVGAVDSIVDICGACIALTLLGVEQVFAAPVATGRGFVQSAHGLLPIPAPATALMIERAKVPLAAAPPEMEATSAELLTPTGAAFLAALAIFQRPAFTPTTIGHGLGQMELPWPNALRVWIGDTAEQVEMPDTCDFVLETNIDDMNPQGIELLMERLLAAGALDAWVTPILMKKQRPAFTVSALCDAAITGELTAVFLRESTTLGVRQYRVNRHKTARAFVTVTTRWGDVQVKLKSIDGRIADAAPEYDDCAALARKFDLPLRDVWYEARRMAEVQIGRVLSDVVGASG